MAQSRYTVPGDAIRVESNDEGLLALASRLWERDGAGEAPHANDAAARPIRLRIRVRAAAPGAPLAPAPEAGAEAERRLGWECRRDDYLARVPGRLRLHVDVPNARVDGDVAAELLAQAPAFAARALLEAPVALLLSRRGFAPLHAGAVVGPAGAVVLRGASGSGKSTLVAAAWRAGLGVLADESLLVSRADAGTLAACVRDLTLLPDAARLLGLEGDTEEAFVGGEEKRRVDLFRSSRPRERAARRAATLLLGRRTPGPARLVPLGREEFLAAFREAELPQERLGADPDPVAEAWAARDSWRLDGADDLEGAVALIGRLAA